jgi:putative protease
VKLVTYIESVFEFEALQNVLNKNATVDIDVDAEIILACSELSRYAKSTKEEMLGLLGLAQKNKIPVTLEWDALYMEEKFQVACHFIDTLPLHDFNAIRVQDPGAVEYIKTKYPWLKIQLILENGNHNLIGLKKWCEYLGDQCERLVVSNELSKEMLKDYASVLTTPLEVLTFGRILLFYSPRLLLSPLEKNQMQQDYQNHNFIETSGSSEESPHTGFPLIENRHGTFMFNVKDLYLLDHLDELSAMGIHHARVDMRFDNSFQNYVFSFCKLFSKTIEENSLTIKKTHVRPLIKGFYNINKTDVLFTKLKNKRTQRNDQNYIGEIVDVERDFQLALLVKTDSLKNISQFDLKMVTPEGKEKIHSLHWMRTSSGNEITEARAFDLVLIPYVNGVTVKTQVYLQNKG